MNVREKLVELIVQKVCDTWSESCDQWLPHDCGKCYANDCLISEIADHLISNGVTVQEWIPQAELPWMGEEIAKLCIRYIEEYADFHGYASSKKVKARIVRLLELEKDGRIAILSQPPKGE